MVDTYSFSSYYSLQRPRGGLYDLQAGFMLALDGLVHVLCLIHLQTYFNGLEIAAGKPLLHAQPHSSLFFRLVIGWSCKVNESFLGRTRTAQLPKNCCGKERPQARST